MLTKLYLSNKYSFFYLFCCMKLKPNQILTIILFLITSLGIKAQTQPILSSLDSLQDFELRLSGIGKEMILSYDEQTRLSSGKNFIIQLSRALKINGSFNYPFDSLKYVNFLNAPDESFRIITWNIATDDEKFRYFGVIQMNPDLATKIHGAYAFRNFYPLIDRSDSANNFLFSELDASRWFGATYYKIILTKHKKQLYYTLLGWDGADKQSNKKIADVLFFREGSPKFGAPIFDLKRKQVYYRMVFEYNNAASMGLKYNDKYKYLLFENLVPNKDANIGNPAYYFPDGSFDYCIWKDGRWLKQDKILEMIPE